MKKTWKNLAIGSYRSNYFGFRKNHYGLIKANKFRILIKFSDSVIGLCIIVQDDYAPLDLDSPLYCLYFIQDL